MSEVLQGKVKIFNKEKGFGFIQPNNGGKDVFVHISAVKNSYLEHLNENDVVEFVTAEGKNGKVQAKNIRIMN